MKGRLHQQRGAALVEMVLVLPLLLVLAFGIIDVGRLIFTQITLNEAVQEGALYAGTHPDDPNGARLRILDSLDDSVIALADVTVSCPSPSTIRVGLTHDMTLITPWLSGATMLPLRATSSQPTPAWPRPDVLLLPSSPCVPGP